MKAELYKHLTEQTAGLKTSGLYKEERIITSPQQAAINVKDAAIQNESFLFKTD